MPYYVSLGNWTDQGIRSVKESPKRAEAYRKLVETAGGKVHFLLYTMGPYDFVAVGELPSDEAANEIALKIGMAGNIRTTTMKAWTEEDFKRWVPKL